jgi:hypothetical protein
MGSYLLDANFGTVQLVEYLIIENVHRLANACGTGASLRAQFRGAFHMGSYDGEACIGEIQPSNT